LLGCQTMSAILSDEVPPSLGPSRNAPSRIGQRFCPKQSRLKTHPVARQRQAGVSCSAVSATRELDEVPLPTTIRKEWPMPPAEPKRFPDSDLVEDSTLPSESSRDRGAEESALEHPHGLSERVAVSQRELSALGQGNLEGVTALSSQGLEPCTTKEIQVARLRRVMLWWTLSVLTVLIFIPVFIPAQQSYCLEVGGPLLTVAAGIVGIRIRGPLVAHPYPSLEG
jgi:hypothetical protein